ncbi:hypothetical protein BDV19DRAFT_390143 [Aspergillus venezuelensis]
MPAWLIKTQHPSISTKTIRNPLNRRLNNQLCHCLRPTNPTWTVNLTLAYLESPTNTPPNPIIFTPPDVTDISRYKLQYLINSQWRDAVLGFGCMAGVDFDEFSENYEMNVSEDYGSFKTLVPEEVYETTFPVSQLDWECPVEDTVGPAGDVFQLQYLGGRWEWWDYGRREEHKQTAVTFILLGDGVGPKGSDGRQNLVLQKSNVLEARWCKP